MSFDDGGSIPSLIASQLSHDDVYEHDTVADGAGVTSALLGPGHGGGAGGTSSPDQRLMRWA